MGKHCWGKKLSLHGVSTACSYTDWTSTMPLQRRLGEANVGRWPSREPVATGDTPVCKVHPHPSISTVMARNSTNGLTPEATSRDGGGADNRKLGTGTASRTNQQTTHGRSLAEAQKKVTRLFLDSCSSSRCVCFDGATCKSTAASSCQVRARVSAESPQRALALEGRVDRDR